MINKHQEETDSGDLSLFC